MKWSFPRNHSIPSY